MAHKYHGRSPDEFRQFLEGIREQDRRRARFRNIMIIANTLFMMIILGLMGKLLLGKHNQKLNESPHIEFSDFSAYLVIGDWKTTDSEKRFFFFVKNISQNPSQFPEKGAKIRLFLKLEGADNASQVCADQTLDWETKYILPGEEKYFLSAVSRKDLSPICEKEIFRQGTELGKGLSLFKLDKPLPLEESLIYANPEQNEQKFTIHKSQNTD